MTTSKRYLGIAVCAVIAACSSSSSTVVPPPPPPAAAHLYVGDDNASGSLRAYALPLTAASTPTATVPMNSPFTIGVNETTLAVATLNDNLFFFHLPLASGSVAFANFAAGSDGTPLFLPSSSLYQGGSGVINIYTAPFSNTSTPSGSVTTTSLSPADLAIDPNGNVYETGGANTIGVVTGGVLTTTLTAATGVQFRGLAATTTQLFACGFLGQVDNIYIYTLPLTAFAVPAATIAFGPIGLEGCAVDASGNLYAGTTSGQIMVFAPPFSSSSVPALTLATPSLIFGLAVGP